MADLSVLSDSLHPLNLYPARLLCPWDSPVKNPGVGCHFLLQGIFPIQRSNLHLLHCRRILYILSHQESPVGSGVRTHFSGSKAVTKFMLICEFT